MRVVLSIEHPIAGEVLSQRRAVQEPPERLESLGGTQETVDRNAAALFDRLSRRVEDFHERHRAGGDAHCRLHEVSLGTETRKGESSSSSPLVNQCLLFQRVEDSDETIVDREHKTGREQLQLEARVHQGRTIRKELEARDDSEKLPRGLLDLRLGSAIIPFRLSEIPGNARKQFLGSFDDSALVVFLEIPLLENTQRVLGQFRIWLTGHDLEGP